MSKAGLFMARHLQDKKIELYVGDESDWYSYADNDSMSYVLIVGTFIDYEEDSGIITLKTKTGHTIWISETKVEMFWEAGKRFNILEATTSTIRSGKNLNKNRDII